MFWIIFPVLCWFVIVRGAFYYIWGLTQLQPLTCFTCKWMILSELVVTVLISFSVLSDSFQFNKDSLKYLDTIPGRVLVVVSDGGSGQSARLLGLSDEFVHQSCKAYGAVAAVERTDQRQVPTPETRIHGIYFDLVAYGNDLQEEEYPAAFHLKLFGSLRNRYMSLAVPKCEAKLVKMLKVVLDQSVRKLLIHTYINIYRLLLKKPGYRACYQIMSDASPAGPQK